MPHTCIVYMQVSSALNFFTCLLSKFGFSECECVVVVVVASAAWNKIEYFRCFCYAEHVMCGHVAMDTEKVDNADVLSLILCVECVLFTLCDDSIDIMVQ